MPSTVRRPRHRGDERDGRSARWDEHRAARRAELVDAAVEAVRRHGPAVAMEDIAAAAGVTKPVLYRHFTDRSDLHLAVGHRVADLLTSRLDEVLSAAGPEVDRDRVRRVVHTYLSMIEHDSALYRFVVRRQGTDDDLVDDYSTVVSLRLARVLREQLRSLGRDSGPSEAWAFALVGTVQAAGDWWIDRPTMSAADLADYLADLLWGGVASRLV